MKLVFAAVMFITFLLVTRARKGRPMPHPRELRNAFNREASVQPGMRYPHTCEVCVPIQQWGRYDLYCCNRDRWPVAVARYGPGVSEYVSNSDLRLPDEGIRITFNRA